jgi:hypothetical protein
MDPPAKVREDVGRPGKGGGWVIVRSADSQSSSSEALPSCCGPVDVLFKELDWKDLTGGGFVWKVLGVEDEPPSQVLGFRPASGFWEEPGGRAVKLSPTS